MLRPDGQPWSLTVTGLDHPLREIPRWVLNIGAKIVRGQALALGEEEKLIVWRETQERRRERLWPDDHARVKRRWFEIQ